MLRFSGATAQLANYTDVAAKLSILARSYRPNLTPPTPFSLPTFVPVDPQQKTSSGSSQPLNQAAQDVVATADLLADQPTATEPTGRFQQLVALLPTTIMWALIAQGVLSVTRLLTTMTVGGTFGSGNEVQLGYYSNAFGALMILIALFEAFVTTPLTVFNQKQTQRQRSLFSGHMLSIGLLLIGFLAAVGGIIALAQVQLKFLKPELAPALLAVGAMAPFQLVREFSRRWLLANLEVKASAVLEIAFAALFFVAVFTLVSLEQVTAVSMLLALAAINAVGLMGWWAKYRGRFRFQPEENANVSNQVSLSEQIGNNFRYGRWVAGENVCSVLTMYFCNWYLMYQLDEKAAGVFFACFTIVMLANPFLLGISSVLAPKSAKAFNDSGYPGLLKTLLKFGSVLMVVMMLFSALLWFAGDRLTLLLFPADYKTYFVEHLGGKKPNRRRAWIGIAGNGHELHRRVRTTCGPSPSRQFRFGGGRGNRFDRCELNVCRNYLDDGRDKLYYLVFRSYDLPSNMFDNSIHDCRLKPKPFNKLTPLIHFNLEQKTWTLQSL